MEISLENLYVDIGALRVKWVSIMQGLTAVEIFQCLN